MRLKITLFKVSMRPLVLHKCGAWITTETDENKLVRYIQSKDFLDRNETSEENIR